MTTHATAPNLTLVQDLARCAGLQLTPERAAVVLPLLQAVLDGAARLETLDFGMTPAVGAVWSEVASDGR